MCLSADMRPRGWCSTSVVPCWFSFPIHRWSLSNIWGIFFLLNGAVFNQVSGPQRSGASSQYRARLKSFYDATQSLTWMGKELRLHRARVAHKCEGLADVWGGHQCVSLLCYTRKPLQQLFGRIGWLARPSFSMGYFIAEERTWLHRGPPSACCLPFVVCRGLLQAIAAGSHGWDSHEVQGPAVHIYTNAVESSSWVSELYDGVWSSLGPPMRRCLSSVDT